MKAKLKSYEFWVSLISAVMAILQSVALKFNVPLIQEIVTGFLGALAVAGILKKNGGKASGDTAATEKEREDSDENSAQ